MGITPGPDVQLDHRELEFAVLASIDLTVANFSKSNLANVALISSTLTNANLAGTLVTGARFDNTTGFTKEQLYSTQSYEDKNLEGIGLKQNDLTGWDFSGQNLANAELSRSLGRRSWSPMGGSNATPPTMGLPTGDDLGEKLVGQQTLGW